jgi:NADH-quinone oxidoreductase subunit J
MSLFADSSSLGISWQMVLPLALGAVALYLLLPKPHKRPVALGAGLGLLAVLLAGVLLFRGGADRLPERLLFWIFSALAIVGAGAMLTQRNPARAAISFALVVMNVCGLFLLQGAPFLMAATIIIYAGAIIVTFLFVLMLAQQRGFSDADDRTREPFLASFAGFILL